MSDEIEHEAIHGWFGLSYANYLVLPRSVLQSMPDEWQTRFVACLLELREAARDLPDPAYDVRVLARPRVRLDYEDCVACNATGKDVDAEGSNDAECEECDGTGEQEADRYETPEEVGFITDPIPHYNRGRTRVELNT